MLYRENRKEILRDFAKEIKEEKERKRRKKIGRAMADAAKAQLRQEVKAAREAIDKKEWKTALQHCKEALKLDPKNYNVLVFVGLAAAELGQEKQSEEAYRRATTLQPNTLLAWQVRSS